MSRSLDHSLISLKNKWEMATEIEAQTYKHFLEKKHENSELNLS